MRGPTVTIHGDMSHTHEQKGRAWDEVDLFSCNAHTDEPSAANIPGRGRANAWFLNSEGSGQASTTVRVRTSPPPTGEEFCRYHMSPEMLWQWWRSWYLMVTFIYKFPKESRRGLDRLLWKKERKISQRLKPACSPECTSPILRSCSWKVWEPGMGVLENSHGSNC